MDQKAIEHLTTIALRFVGVLIVFIGLILTTHTILQLVAAQAAASGLPQGYPPGMSINVKGVLGTAGNWAIACTAAIVVWGCLISVFARPIAKRIARQ
ncbi:MAG: hypothetical protein GY869_21710 [Planctomycetes bacterium]|nr:hypothetical protein [Planctomycetota bacterium]